MSTQFTMQRTHPGNTGAGLPRNRDISQTWKLLAAGAVTAAALAIVPVLLPELANSLSATSVHAYWYISRAAAFVAFGLLWLSMLAGLGITSKLGRFWPGMPCTFEMHRFTALLGIGFGLVHALVLLGDKYMSYSIGQLLVPFMGSNYRPEWVGFGQLALYILAVVAFSFSLRDRLGVHAWRLIHMLSFSLFLMVLIHGVQSGTDTQNPLAQALYWGSAGSVLIGTVYRVVAARRGRARTALTAHGLIAAAGRMQAPPKQSSL